MSETNGTADEFWLFGYGSLIWKPPPHFDRRIPGYVTGYVRRFWQTDKRAPEGGRKGNSQDHRGTPEAPGRVVTLIDRDFWASLVDAHASAPEKVWGVAYRIEAAHVDEVRDYLDIREINGYTIHYSPFQPAAAGAAPIRTLVYIGTPDNDQFTGPQDPQQLAEHIWRSEGPSGLNREYLWNLEKSLDELSPESGDEHVTDLSNRVREIDARHNKGLSVNGTAIYHDEEPSSPHEFRKVRSVDEQEETE